MNKVIWNVRKSRTAYCEVSMIQRSKCYEIHYYSEYDSYVNEYKTYTEAFKSMLNLLKELE